MIEVVPNTGDVYAAYLNGFNVVFLKSTDHGLTWSVPINTYGNVSWNDKPALAMSDDGRDVYISFNGPTGGDPWIAQWHDFGETWTQTKLVDSKRYYFAFDADVLHDGTHRLRREQHLVHGSGRRARGRRQARRHFARRWRELEAGRGRYGRRGGTLRVGGVRTGLLHRSRCRLGRRQRATGLPLRRSYDRPRAAADLREDVLGRGHHVERKEGPLGRWRERHDTCGGAGRERRRASLVHADRQR